MKNSLGEAKNNPIIDWELDRHWHTGNVLLRLRYFTAAMQDLEDAERGEVYSLTVEKASELSKALELALRRSVPKP